MVVVGTAATVVVDDDVAVAVALIGIAFCGVTLGATVEVDDEDDDDTRSVGCCCILFVDTFSALI